MIEAICQPIEPKYLRVLTVSESVVRADWLHARGALLHSPTPLNIIRFRGSGLRPENI
jgi:hypothetical protein